jgi:hypothetical protein
MMIVACIAMMCLMALGGMRHHAAGKDSQPVMIDDTAAKNVEGGATDSKKASPGEEYHHEP